MYWGRLLAYKIKKAGQEVWKRILGEYVVISAVGLRSFAVGSVLFVSTADISAYMSRR
jgi:hypothetical protein